MIFVERHILAEYLHEHHEVELALHAAAVENGCAPTDDLLPARWESTEMRARRESFNQVRRGSPLLQQLQQEPLATIDNRGHRLEWTGAVVGHIHDLHYAGYVTQCCVPLLRGYILERRFAEYEEAASYYLREVISQIGTFPGGHLQCSMDTAGWAEGMEEELWRNFVMHGLDLWRTARPSSSSSSSSDDVTGDEMGLVQHKPHQRWLKKGPSRQRRAPATSGRRPGRRPTETPPSRPTTLRPGIWRRLQRENPGSLGPVRAAQTPRGPNLGPKHGRRLAGLLLVNAKEKGMGLDHLPLLPGPQICLPRSRSTQRLTRGCLPLECGMLTIQWENTCYILTPWPTLGTPSWTTANKTAWS